MCWAFPQGKGPKVPSITFERNLFLNPVIRITTVIMVFVDIKIASIVTGGREAPKAEGLYLYIITEGLTKLLTNICQHLSARQPMPNKRNQHSPIFFWLTNYCLILVSYSHTQKKAQHTEKKASAWDFVWPVFV